MLSRNTKKQKIVNLILLAALIIVAFLYTLPVIAMVGTAFKSDAEVLSTNSLFPIAPTLDSFATVLQTNFVSSAFNSMKVGVLVTLGCTLLACCTGYALSRFKGRFFSGYGMGLMVLQMFPMMLMLIPLFIIFSNLGIMGSHLTLVLSYICLNLPFCVWLMKGFFDTIPYELEESAYIDGCGKLRCLVQIIVPIVLPGLATVAIFAFLNSWNEYLFANTFVKGNDMVTLTVSLQQFVAKNRISWGQMMAASTLGIIPSMCFLLLAQKYLVQGMTAGSVKG